MSSFSSEVAFVQPPRVFWPLLGLSIVLSSGIATFLITRIFPFPDFLYIYSCVAALLTGVPLWWLLIIRPGRATPKRGCLVGMLGSSLAPPLMLLIAALFSQVNSLLSIGIAPDTVVILMIWSPIFVGWLTVPLGAVTGVLLIYLQLALTQRQWPPKMLAEK